jgi:hypothetical protein
MRRFVVHFVTGVDFVDGDEASDDVAQNYKRHLRGDGSGRGPEPLAPNDQERPGRESSGRRNQG